MPSDEYTAVSKGGLKLKGVSGSKIEKHRKKKKRPKEDAVLDAQSSSSARQQQPESEEQQEEGSSISRRESAIEDALGDEDGRLVRGRRDEEDVDRDPDRNAHKTDAERKHDELRRKRLDERLKREGVKTHKERVEELNRYLSSLSEHHDMPRIGPG